MPAACSALFYFSEHNKLIWLVQPSRLAAAAVCDWLEVCKCFWGTQGQQRHQEQWLGTQHCSTRLQKLIQRLAPDSSRYIRPVMLSLSVLCTQHVWLGACMQHLRTIEQAILRYHKTGQKQQNPSVVTSYLSL